MKFGPIWSIVEAFVQGLQSISSFGVQEKELKGPFKGIVNDLGRIEINCYCWHTHGDLLAGRDEF